MGRLLGVRAYARYRGCSHVAVLKAITSGRLFASITLDHRGHPRIDPESADREWSETTNPAQVRERHRGPIRDRSQPLLFPDAEVGSNPDDGGTSVDPRLTTARAVLLTYKARLLQLEYEGRTGQLIPVEKVKNEAFSLGRVVRDALLTGPNRISAQLAAETDVDRVRALLMEELERALQPLL